MRLKEIRKNWIDKCHDGDTKALDMLMENDLKLIGLLLNVAEAARVYIEEHKLIPKNSHLAEAMEELELEEWTEIP